MAPALKATVPDLTVIAKNNGGKFPVARVRRIIMGEGMIASHGSREMPVWGPIFSPGGGGRGSWPGEAGEFGEIFGIDSVNEIGGAVQCALESL